MRCSGLMGLDRFSLSLYGTLSCCQHYTEHWWLHASYSKVYRGLYGLLCNYILWVQNHCSPLPTKQTVHFTLNEPECKSFPGLPTEPCILLPSGLVLYYRPLLHSDKPVKSYKRWSRFICKYTYIMHEGSRWVGHSRGLGCCMCCSHVQRILTLWPQHPASSRSDKWLVFIHFLKFTTWFLLLSRSKGMIAVAHTVHQICISIAVFLFHLFVINLTL